MNDEYSPLDSPVYYDKQGNILDMNTTPMNVEMGTKKHWTDELSRQRKLHEQGGEIDPQQSILGSMIVKSMEANQADPETIKLWTGKNLYTPPPNVDPELEKYWGKDIVSKNGYKRGGKIGNFNGNDHVPFHGGLLGGDGGGRTDNLKIKVPHDAYVIPADVVSGLGEGATAAGAKTLDKMFGGGTHAKKGSFAKGGFVPIIAASGEYVIHPEAVRRVGKGNLSHGHAVLDHFVKHVRAKNIKETKNLEPPKK